MNLPDRKENNGNENLPDGKENNENVKLIFFQKWFRFIHSFNKFAKRIHHHVSLKECYFYLVPDHLFVQSYHSSHFHF